MNDLMNRLGLIAFASIFPKETLNMGEWLVRCWCFRHERKIIVTFCFKKYFNAQLGFNHNPRK